jgi:hypothetical protein
MKNFNNFFLTIALSVSGMITAQVKIGDNATTIHPSTVLEIESTNKGFLMPRVSNPSSISSPATGLQVYNTTTNTVWFYNGTAWTEMGAGSSGSNIYTADGQLTGARIVDQNNNNLTFQTGTARTIVNGNFQFSKALYANIRTHSLASNIAWTADDFAVVITNLGISGQLLLPDPTTNAGRILSIRNNAGGTVTFAAGSGAPINQSSIAGGSGYMYMSDGTNWHPIGSR